MTDNGPWDDHWPDDAVRTIKGAQLIINDIIGPVYLDPAGCSPTVTSSGHGLWEFDLTTTGVAGSTSIAVTNSGILQTQTVIADVPDNGGTVNLSIPQTASFRVFTTLAHIIDARFRGSMSGRSIRVNLSPTAPTSSSEDANGNGLITLASGSTANHTTLKYIQAHEYGHINLFLTTTNTIVPPGYCGVGGTLAHNWGTQEDQSCALFEGWAHLVAVDCWQNDTQEDGYFFFNGAQAACGNPFGNVDVTDHCPTWNGVAENLNVIDAESTGCWDRCFVEYMENVYPSGTWPGRSVELDWMRMFWDYHTNNPGGGGGVVPSHSQLQAEYGAAGNMTAANAYDKYRQGVAAHSGCAQYQRAVYYAAANGTNHCDGTCDNVSGCTDCDTSCCGFTPCP